MQKSFLYSELAPLTFCSILQIYEASQFNNTNTKQDSNLEEILFVSQKALHT